MRTDAGRHEEGAGSGWTDDDLLAYLATRRWFGEKGAKIRRAELVDRIPVRWPQSSDEFAVGRVRVEPAEGEASFYQLFLRANERRITDALEDDAFRHGLVAAFAAGTTCTNGDTRWVIQSESEAPFKAPADAAIRVSTAEQSNTSLFVGTQAVLKLFRKIAPGVHPDIEVARFLTVERRFLHTPALLGCIHFVDQEGSWAAGLLQEMVPGATDAWRHALECSRPWFESADAGEPPFQGEAERLGTITREMHDVLASGDQGSPFMRSDATRDDVAQWTEAAVAMMRRALASAEMIADAGALERRIRGLSRDVGADAGARIRIHGDYHLGQVLRSVTNAFLVVDFEGEPARALEERRRPQSPLRDVAGMLRSFAYAAATLGAGNDEKQRQWERAVRAAFLRGYFTPPPAPKAGSRKHTSLLPSRRENADRLIALFEAEKACYELQYEIDHRPDWAWIPLRAIARLGA